MAAAELARIAELKALIASEIAELSRLRLAYQQNELALTQARETNARLVAEVTSIRRTAAAHKAATAASLIHVST